MQTFLPEQDFVECAKALDTQRLNKQIIEAFQIENAIIKHLKGETSGWQSHPVILMWYNYLDALRYYRHCMAVEFEARGYGRHKNYCEPVRTYKPSWLSKRVTDSHRAMLYRKDPSFYPESWKDDSIKDYYWPWRDDVINYPRNEVMKFPSGETGSKPLDQLTYPCFGSIKYDGSFCLIFDGELYSRNLILHPNRLMRPRFKPLLELSKAKELVFMGELLDPTLRFSESQSIIRSYADELGNTSLFIFDCVSMSAWMNKHGWLRFKTRYDIYRQAVESLTNEFIHPVVQEEIYTVDHAKLFYDKTISAGHEGIVTRNPDAYYKYGRCTAQENIIFRHTEEKRDDVIVLEILEATRRLDSVVPPKLLDGRAHRSFKRADYELCGMAGSLRVRSSDGKEFLVGFGKGFDNKSKRRLWVHRDEYIGRTAEIKFKATGGKDVPRQPKLVRFRDDK